MVSQPLGPSGPLLSGSSVLYGFHACQFGLFRKREPIPASKQMFCSNVLVSLACPQVQVDDIQLSVVQTIPHCDLHVLLTFVMPKDKEFWGKYNEYADTYDKYLLEGWNGNLDVILIFASHAFCSDVFSDFSTYVFRLACSLVSMVGSSSRQMHPCSKIPATISSTCCK